MMYDGAIEKPKPQDSAAFEHTKILTEIRLMYQALEEQASTLGRLTQEIMSIKDLLLPDIPLGNASKNTIESIEDQKKTILKIRSFLISFVNGLKENDHIKNSYTYQMALLDSYLEELETTSGVGQICRTDSLSSRELRIVSMIKVGMTTEQIAERFHIASDTVKTHRRNIRRKLDIVGKKNDLASHLRMASSALFHHSSG